MGAAIGKRMGEATGRSRERVPGTKNKKWQRTSLRSLWWKCRVEIMKDPTDHGMT
jgi:hypothetical protein